MANHVTLEQAMQDQQYIDKRALLTAEQAIDAKSEKAKKLGNELAELVFSLTGRH